MIFPDRDFSAAEASDGNYEGWLESVVWSFSDLASRIIVPGGKLKPGFIVQHNPILVNSRDIFEALFIAENLKPVARIHLFLQENKLVEYCYQFGISAFVVKEHRQEGILKKSLQFCHDEIQSIISREGQMKPAIIATQIGIPNTPTYSLLRSKIIGLHLQMGYQPFDLNAGRLTKEIYPI